MTLKLKVVSGSKDYFPSILSLIKKSKSKVCYIALNRSCDFLRESFKKNKIDTKKLYSLDCITKALKSAKKISNCEYLQDAQDLNNISRSIKRAINKGHTLIIFDSLSSLLVHEQDFPAGGNVLVDFIKSFSSLLKEKKGKAIFLIKKQDKQKALIKETIPLFKR
jgi:hypothetical protein